MADLKKEGRHMYGQIPLPNNLVSGERICKEAERMLN